MNIKKTTLTQVRNLSTGIISYYSLSPRDAVKAAYLQSKGDFDTWNYDTKNVALQVGKKTVLAGDFCAMLDD